MSHPLLYALLAAVGNAVYVYAQRGAVVPSNPFLYVAGAVAVCLVLFVIASMIFRTPEDGQYLADNWAMILIGGVGFFITFVGFFLLYNTFGASQYSLYAVLSILTTSVGVGLLIFREPFNMYQVGGTTLAILAIVLFTYGKTKGAA